MSTRVPGPTLGTPAEALWEELESASSLPRWPIALRVRKPGRGSAGDGWVTVAKLTSFVGDTQPILAIAWKEQRGTSRKVSVPAIVLDFAERAGARFLYLADFQRALMARMPVSQVRRGLLQADGEFYVDIADLESVAFRKWLYAAETKDLDRPGKLGGESRIMPGRTEQPGLPGFGVACR
jgi:hypothetical protein